jgi:hypothetical protein
VLPGGASGSLGASLMTSARGPSLTGLVQTAPARADEAARSRAHPRAVQIACHFPIPGGLALLNSCFREWCRRGNNRVTLNAGRQFRHRINTPIPWQRSGSDSGARPQTRIRTRPRGPPWPGAAGISLRRRRHPRPGITDGCFINYPDVDLPPSWPALYYKAGYPALQAVKARWDPRNVFHHAQSITPAVP